MNQSYTMRLNFEVGFLNKFSIRLFPLKGDPCLGGPPLPKKKKGKKRKKLPELDRE